MSRIICINQPEVIRFVESHANCVFRDGSDQCLGVADTTFGVLIPRGGVLYQNFTGASCWMQVAGRDEQWMTRDFLAMAFHYPFVQLGCAALFAVIPETNALSRRFARKLGFREVATLPLMFADCHGIVITMTRGECRWLGLTLRTMKAGAG